MLEILENFESAMSGAERLSPAVLIGPGGAAVIAGLFVWLGGLGFKRMLAAISGAICGGILASAVIGLTVVPTAASVALAVVAAMVFEKVFITALAAGLATAAGIAFFIGPYIQISPVTEPVRQGQAATLSGGQSMSKVKAWIIDVRGAIGQACSQMPAHKWALTAVLGLVIVVGGSFLWRLTAAMYFSTAGTILVFAGMILLLIYKGVMPVSRICRRPSVYSGVFAVMVAFGTAEQLLLCRGGKARSNKKQTGNNSSKNERK